MKDDRAQVFIRQSSNFCCGLSVDGHR